MNLFTSEEIYVLASLLGREFIVGIEGRTLENNRSDLLGMFRKNYSDLESRGVFEYRMDGTLLIDHDVRRIIKVLNRADSVFVVSTDIKGKREKITYLSYDNQFCKLIDLDSKYSMEMINEFSFLSILDSFGVVIPSASVKTISIPLVDYKEIDSLYNSFNRNEADKYLTRLVSDLEAERMIRECLVSKSGSFVLKEYSKADSHLVPKNDLFLRVTSDHILRFSIDDGETVIVNIYKKED